MAVYFASCICLWSVRMCVSRIHTDHMGGSELTKKKENIMLKMKGKLCTKKGLTVHIRT